MTTFGGWEQLEQLGEGGQSTVFLVRSPERMQERKTAVQAASAASPWQNYLNDLERSERIKELAAALWKYVRPDQPSELGALKLFKIPEGSEDASEALGRLQNEIAALERKIPGLIRLLAYNEKDKWMVTEYMREGTIDKHTGAYKGNVVRALKAFRSLVETVASLHKDGIVHRDIKPANVFRVGDDRLVLGDFGIVFLPNLSERLTMTNERVGPRDYMPQWADLGERLEHVHTNFDVYMLGKLLWCMVSGRLKLPREYHRRQPYDLTVLFPGDFHMPVVNEILDKCIVEEPHLCLKSAQELLVIVDEKLSSLERGSSMLDRSGKFTVPCRVCGKGFYREYSNAQLLTDSHPLLVRSFVCDVCCHYEFFAPGFPREAAERGWKRFQ